MSQTQKKSKEPDKNNAAAVNPAGDGQPEALVENLYKKNIELLVKNKTLSLLSELYEISILTLKPQELAARVSHAVQVELSFDLVGISVYDAKKNTLTPLAISKSEKITEILHTQGLLLENITVPNVSNRKIYREVICERKEYKSDNCEEMWNELIPEKELKILVSEAKINTTMLFPLMTESKVFGSILLALNRGYETLNAFEKESIKSFVNTIAVALEKSFLYQELETANNQLRELDRQKDELIGLVSHQLATPVTSIKWYLEMMMDGDMGKLTKEEEENIKAMQHITLDLSDLISMILDVSRIQLGRIKIEKQKLDLKEFFHEIMEVIEPKAKEKKINFIKDVTADLPEAMLDKRYTRMTVENLLTNAIKYTPEGGKVTLSVKIKNGKLYCQVADTGMGIPKEDQSKIFGKLFRASNVRNAVDGNGFGLYVAKGAVEAQGGEIGFQSEVNKGTTFFMELPLA